MNNRLFFLLALVGVLLLSTVALAAGQTAIPWDVISGGGGTVSAGNITISDTIGQPIIGLAQAGDVIVESGFWPGFQPIPTNTPTTPPIPTATPTPTATGTPTHSTYLPLLSKG